MKTFLILALVLLCPLLVQGQARTAERIVDVPFSQLNAGNPPNGSVRHVINALEGTTPCTSGGSGALAIKINGVWNCPKLTPGIGTGDVLGPSASAVGELVLFNSTTGKNLGRANTLSGVPLLASGIVTALSTTGTGSVVRSSSATLVSPNLESPSIDEFTAAQHTHESAAEGGQLNASSAFSTGTIPPARVVSGSVTINRCLRISNVGQIEVAASDCGAGGGGSPGGVSGNLIYNETGAFGGASNTAYDLATGTLTLNQKVDTADALLSLRATDSSPTGTFLRFRNAANNADLFFVNATGAVFGSTTITLANIAAPTTPATANTTLWADATDKNLKAKDDAGNVSLTVRAITCSGTDKISSISSAGVVTCTADQTTPAGEGITSLNTLTAADQTFANDTNVTIVSASSTHTITWVGTLAKSRQHAATVYNDAANTWSTGAQSFAAATSLTVPIAAGAGPTANGQIAYDSTGNTLEYGENGTNRIVVNTDGTQTLSNKTLGNSNVLTLRDDRLTLQDSGDVTRQAVFQLSSITAGQTRTVTIADAASVTVQPTTLTANQFLTHVDSAGVQQTAQVDFTDLSGTLSVVQGSTGQTAVAQGDLLYGSATNIWTRLSKSTGGTRYLSNTGASNNPAWAQVDLSNGVTGTLNDASLSANVTLLGSAIDLSGAEATGVLAAGRFPALTGDVTTVAGALATTIAADAVTNAKLANIATQTFKGRTTTGTGDPEDLTATQATAILNTFTTTLKGLVPAPGSTTNSFLRDDGTWVIPSGAGDMLLGSVQTNTAAKTFNPATLIVGGQSAVPTPVAGAFYRDTDDSKLYWAFDGSNWGEVFVSGLSVVNLASANVTGTLPLANGGTNQTSWTAARCVRVNAGGTALEAAAADCGAGGSGTINSGVTNIISKYTASTTLDDSLLSDNGTTLSYSGSGGLSLTGGSGAGYVQLPEGSAPSLVANQFQIVAPADVAAGGLALILPGTAASGIVRLANSSGTMTMTMDAGVSHLAASSSADLRGMLSDESGTGAAVFAGGSIGAGTATTASANDSSTLIATTAYVQSELTAYAADTKTLTNTTIDAEATGNSISRYFFIEFIAAGVNGATAGPMLDLPSANAPAAAVITGTNTIYGVLDFDAATDESVQGSFLLPDDWTGAIDFYVDWQAAATTGNAIFALQTICVADSESSDPVFNTAQTITDAAQGTANRRNAASLTAITTTGCAAGERFHFKFYRDADNASDTMTGDARVKAILFKLRGLQ